MLGQELFDAQAQAGVAIARTVQQDSATRRIVLLKSVDEYFAFEHGVLSLDLWGYFYSA
jgi:hypothetical protein